MKKHYEGIFVKVLNLSCDVVTVSPPTFGSDTLDDWGTDIW